MSHWIMEVICVCKKCRGMKFADLGDISKGHCPECGGMGEAWYPVHPKNGQVYSYESKELAGRVLRICYRESIRDWNLGGEPTARVREVVNVPEPGTPGPRFEPLPDVPEPEK